MFKLFPPPGVLSPPSLPPGPPTVLLGEGALWNPLGLAPAPLPAGSLPCTLLPPTKRPFTLISMSMKYMPVLCQALGMLR